MLVGGCSIAMAPASHTQNYSKFFNQQAIIHII